MQIGTKIYYIFDLEFRFSRQNLVARIRSMRDQHEHDEKKLLNDIRELDRLVENNNTSKNFLIKKSNIRQKQIQLNELFAGKRKKKIMIFFSLHYFQ